MATPDIAIIGMACRFPGADGYEQFWDNLASGRESILRSGGPAADAEGATDPSVAHRVNALGRTEGIEEFDADHFRVAPSEAITMDPQQRVLLEVAAQALEDAGYAGDRGDTLVGVYVGGGENLYFRDFVAPTVGAEHLDDLRIVTGNGKHFLAPRLAFKLGLTGPSITVHASCATGLTAVAMACSALAAGECDLAIAGGVSLQMPDVDGYTYRPGGILSADGTCRTFDGSASGTVPGSGAGVVVLKRDADATADLDHRHAVLRGWAVNNDGGSRAGFTAPNVSGQETVIRTAMARAGVAPAEVAYIELHGTGTAIGDVVEAEALRRVYGAPDAIPGGCHLGSVKPNIGHADAASGVAGLIKTALVLEHAVVPPMVRFTSLNPGIDLGSTPFTVNTDASPWDAGRPRVAAVSSFGLGGNNAHVILTAGDPLGTSGASAEPTARAEQVLALSARTPTELVRLRALIAARLEAVPPGSGAELADVAYSLSVGRPRHAHRWAAVVTNTVEAVHALRTGGAPARTSARWSLHVAADPSPLAKVGEREIEREPLVRDAVEGFCHIDLAELSPVRAAAVGVVGIARALSAVGLDFGRCSGPRWLQPALDWMRVDGTPPGLGQALDACEMHPEEWRADKRVDAGALRDGPGVVALVEGFSFANAVAAAWSAGAEVNWTGFYAGELRRRIPLPTYPFTRERFWLARPASAAEAATDDSAPAKDGTTDGDVGDLVAQVWCEVLGVDIVAPGAHFVDDLGGDSVFAVEIGARLSEALRTDLPVDLPFVAPTLAKATAFIQNVLDQSTKELAR